MDKRHSPVGPRQGAEAVRQLCATGQSFMGMVRAAVGSKFARNVAVVATGTAAAQAIALGFSPIITRLYGPEAFGVLGTFTALLSILAPLAAFCYPIAIVLPQHDKEAAHITSLALLIGGATAAVAGGGLAIFGAPIANLLGFETLGIWIYLLPVGMFFVVLLAISTQWVIRKKCFGLKAKVAVLQSLIINSAKAGFGLLAPVAGTLISLTVIGTFVHALIIWLALKKSGLSLQAGGSWNVSRYKLVAKNYRDFPLYRAPQVFLNSTSQGLPVLVLASLFGVGAAGFYSLARTILTVPTTLVGQSVSSVFYPRINEAVNDGENAKGLLVKATGALALIGLIPYGTIAIFGPSIFGIAFGNDWVQAGEMARWLALWSYFGFINRPSVAAIPVLKLQRLFLIYEVVSILVRLSALTVGFAIFSSPVAAIAIYSVVGALLNLFLIGVTICSLSGLGCIKKYYD